MKNLAVLGYSLTLALWVGGMFIFTFLLTPVIFGSFNRDEAGRIVGALFEGYFYYVLALSLAALVLAHYASSDRSARPYWLKMALLSSAVVVNLFVSFLLYPEIKEVKANVASFVNVPEDSEARVAFGRLHAISSVLNLLVMADGAALLLMNAKGMGDDEE